MSDAVCSVSPLSQHLKFQAFRPNWPITMLPAYRLRTWNTVKYGRWDPNAEEMGRSDRFGFNPREEEGGWKSGRKKRRWWSDEPEADDEEEMSIAEEFIDSTWILKVFSSYGWALPFVLLSLLASTGPKAFLMTMLLPLGQSVVTFAFNRLSGKKRTKPKVQSRKRRRKRPSNAESNNMRMNEEGRQGRSRASRNGNLEGQSWVDDGKFSTDGGHGSTSFGGWEELDGIRFQDKSSGDFGRPSLKSEDKSKKLRSEEEAPLLLRVLVALFPFLGHWTKIF